jgi:large subunit ribosomal protein L18e
MVKSGPTNPIAIKLARELRKTGAPIWKRVAELMERPTRNRVEVNLVEISRFAKSGETIVVPGKVLATGDLKEKKVSIACQKISKVAAEKVKKSGGKIMTLSEAAKESPKGTGLRLFA